MSKKPCPANGVKLDVEIWMKLVEEALGEGPVLDAVRKTRLGIELGERRTEEYTNAQMAALSAWWMVQGAANAVLHSHRTVDPAADLEPVMKPWKELDERSKLVLHNLDRLPEEMRLWRESQ